MKKILVADDDPTIRLLVNATLRRDSYQLMEAVDGEQTLEVARAEHPDLILLDVGMPKLDGFEVCRRLKSDPDTGAIHIVMLTARAQAAERELGDEVGADGYFTKPFSPLALLDTISDVLG
jgi:two-component system phosphate regulon response regulator PhoB